MVILSCMSVRTYRLRQLAWLFLFAFFVCGCSGKPVPVKVNGDLKFGQYIISPPEGYWYLPRIFPSEFKTPKDIFLIAFWENKEAALRKTAPSQIGVLFNFAVSVNTYKDWEAYYKAAKAFGLTYQELPNEATPFKNMANWSCKERGQGIYGIECISLADNLITIGVYGFDKDAVLSKLPLLQKLVESFKKV